MRHPIALVLTGLAGCAVGSSAEPPTQPAHLERIAYEAPLQWGHTDALIDRGMRTTWLPITNDRKESLVVSRVSLEPGRVAPTTDSVRDLLLAAQGQLPHAEIGGAQTFVTSQGLQGVRVEADFRPAGASGKYHRVHAIILEGDHYIHVLYTAQQPDWSHHAFDLLVDSLHEEA